ncbi:MAG: hypothetical protein HY830_00710 [Actinobacteria bacterium]|nr:hypothetical protein [Actinomycetota bacterium]
MARQPVFLVGVGLGYLVLAIFLALDHDPYAPVVLTLPLVGAFYIGLTSVIAAAWLTRSTEVAVEAVATAPGTEARRTLALAAAGLPPFVAGLVFSAGIVVAAQVLGVAPQEWWFGTLPDWQVWSLLLMCPVACLDGALLGVLAGRWLRFRGAPAMVLVALIVVSLLGQVPLLDTSSSEWRLWVPWAVFHTGDNADGTQTLIAGNPGAYLGYLLALGVLAVLGAMWHDRAARTPRFRVLAASVAVAALALLALAVTTGNHDNRISDPIPSRATR